VNARGKFGDNIKMVSNETSFDDVEWIHLVQDMYRCWAEGSTAATSYVKEGNFSNA